MNKKYFILSILSILSMHVLIAQDVKLNQIGFYANQEKIAVVPGTSNSSFDVINLLSDEVAYSGTLSSSSYWSPSDENVQIADFSELTEPGEYYINIDDNMYSYSFRISGRVHDELFTNLMRAYYFNRASTAITQEHGGIYARAEGHPDDVVYIHSSAESAERPEGSTISAPKGWYDAGDYGKYIVNSGISVYTLLATYEHFPEFVENRDLNIPESNNTVPDLLDEVKWNLDWMLDMQDPNDGGVYHKLTTLNFTGEEMPEDADADRYVVMKTTAATLDFAAVMAQAARVYNAFETEFPGYADSCLVAAEAAWDWAEANNNVLYSQPRDVRTGAYGDNNVNDEFDWAAAELYITTQNDEYYTATSLQSSGIGVPGWNGVSALAWMSLGHHIDNLTDIANTSVIERRLTGLADDIVDQYESSAYKVTIENFYWGSNSLAANEGMMLLQAYKLTGDEKYLAPALADLDYLLGRNATGYCFVTGEGTLSPMDIHHRVSVSDGIDEPVPGFLAGGPNPGQQDDCDYPSNEDALSYSDTWCSYASNEVTINWNAPIAYLAAAMETYLADTTITALSSTGSRTALSVNPTASRSGFKVVSSGNVTYTIINMQGIVVAQGMANSGDVIGENISNGAYTILLSSDTEAEAVKVIKF